MMERLHDRKQAGELLAEKLSALANRPDVIVLGLPGGGVAVACSIATSLRAPLDVFLVRKLGVPEYEELAMGAVAMGDVQVVDPDIVEEFHVSRGEVEKVVDPKLGNCGVGKPPFGVLARRRIFAIVRSSWSTTA